MGDLKDASQDLELLRRLKSSGRFEAASFRRLPEVEAELMMASGDPKDAFAKLRDYGVQTSINNARRFNAGVHQVTGELQTQLENARRNADLKQAVIRTQRWIAVLCALMVNGWEARVSWPRCCLPPRQAIYNAEPCPLCSAC